MMLSDVCRVHPVGACGRPAGWRILADPARLGRPGSRLPLRASSVGPGGGTIVAAARLQLVIIIIMPTPYRIVLENAKIC